jgi:peptide/nickel transport system substrate-binding protein
VPARLIALLCGLLTLGVAPVSARQLTIGVTQYPATLHPAIDSMLAKSYGLAGGLPDL